MPKVGESMAISLFADLHRFSPQSFVSFYYVSWTLNRVSTTDTDSPLLQPRLSKATEDAVSKLLPAYAENDLGSMCSWADRVKFRYHWSSPLHYLNTPDNLCTYQYNSENKISLFSKSVESIEIDSQYASLKANFFLQLGDCKDEDGIKDRCVAGAINNYTTQLLSYRDSSSTCKLSNT